MARCEESCENFQRWQADPDAVLGFFEMTDKGWRCRAGKLIEIANESCEGPLEVVNLNAEEINGKFVLNGVETKPTPLCTHPALMDPTTALAGFENP